MTERLDLPQLVQQSRSRRRTPVPLCKICDLPEYNDPEWLSAASALGLPTDGTYVTKKCWEYTQLLYGLRRLNCIHPQARVLSVGCGAEPLLYYLTSYTAQVIGVDLFEANLADVLEHPERHATMPYHPERLKLLRMNGRRLAFPDNIFDIIYSLSSIEHFGGHQAAAQAMSEIGRVLKPGGIAVIATEFILANSRHPDFFNWSDLFKYVIHPSKLELVESVDWSISDALKEHYVHVRDVESSLYLIIHCGEPPFTTPVASVMVFMMKPQSPFIIDRRAVTSRAWRQSRPDFIPRVRVPYVGDIVQQIAGGAKTWKWVVSLVKENLIRAESWMGKSSTS